MQDIQSNSVTSLAVTCITAGTYIKTHAGSWDQDVYYYIYNTYNMSLAYKMDFDKLNKPTEKLACNCLWTILKKLFTRWEHQIKR